MLHTQTQEEQQRAAVIVWLAGVVFVSMIAGVSAWSNYQDRQRIIKKQLDMIEAFPTTNRVS